MESIIEEFTEPAPVIEKTRLIYKTPLKTVVNKRFPWVGLQKCFVVRHPETVTFYHYYKNLKLKNVHFYAGFPAHSYYKIKSLIAASKNLKNKTVHVDGEGEVPLANLTAVLASKYPPPPNYEEKENLWVTVIGKKAGRRKKTTMECLVPTLPDWKDAGCNIDTGFPASIIGQMIIEGKIKSYGSSSPKIIAPREYFFKKLRQRGMKILTRES